MYILQNILCECGAHMFERPVKAQRDVRAYTCMSRDCAMHGITRYLKMPEVPAEQVVALEPEKTDG